MVSGFIHDLIQWHARLDGAVAGSCWRLWQVEQADLQQALDDEAQVASRTAEKHDRLQHWQVQDFWAAAEVGDFYKDMQTVHDTVPHLVMSSQARRPKPQHQT